MKPNDQKIKSWLLANVFVVAGALISLANLYIFRQLQPLTTRLDEVTIQVMALDEREKANLAEHDQIKKDLLEEIRYVRSRVDSIYSIVR